MVIGFIVSAYRPCRFFLADALGPCILRRPELKGCDQADVENVFQPRSDDWSRPSHENDVSVNRQFLDRLLSVLS
jgi:hypothetical protein